MSRKRGRVYKEIMSRAKIKKGQARSMMPPSIKAHKGRRKSY